LVQQKENTDGSEQEYAVFHAVYIREVQEVPGLQMGKDAETVRRDSRDRQAMVRETTF
jgi:hypothetical protein